MPKPVKLSDCFIEVNENYSINMYDNGYVVEISGKDGDLSWITKKLVIGSLEELIELVTEASNMPRC